MDNRGTIEAGFFFFFNESTWEQVIAEKDEVAIFSAQIFITYVMNFDHENKTFCIASRDGFQ